MTRRKKQPHPDEESPEPAQDTQSHGTPSTTRIELFYEKEIYRKHSLEEKRKTRDISSPTKRPRISDKQPDKKLKQQQPNVPTASLPPERDTTENPSEPWPATSPRPTALSSCPEPAVKVASPKVNTMPPLKDSAKLRIMVGKFEVIKLMKFRTQNRRRYIPSLTSAMKK